MKERRYIIHNLLNTVTNTTISIKRDGVREHFPEVYRRLCYTLPGLMHHVLSRPITDMNPRDSSILLLATQCRRYDRPWNMISRLFSARR